MINQYFKFKIKNEYLPSIVNDYIKNKIITQTRDIVIPVDTIYMIKLTYLRKLKIEKIENRITNNERILLDYLTNDNFTHMLTEKEYKYISNANSIPKTASTVSFWP